MKGTTMEMIDFAQTPDPAAAADQAAYWAHEDMRHAAAEAQITELTRRLAELEEWVEDLAGDMAGHLEGVAP